MPQLDKHGIGIGSKVEKKWLNGDTPTMVTFTSSKVWAVPSRVKRISIWAAGGAGSGGGYTWNSGGGIGGDGGDTTVDGLPNGSLVVGGGKGGNRWSGYAPSSDDLRKRVLLGGEGGIVKSRYIGTLAIQGFRGIGAYGGAYSTVLMEDDSRKSIKMPNSYECSRSGTPISHGSFGGTGALAILINENVESGVKLIITIGAGGIPTASDNGTYAGYGSAGSVVIAY